MFDAKKIKWFYVLPTMVILFVIILNIVLLCTDVFRGTYSCTTNSKNSYNSSTHTITEITFYDNTYNEKSYQNNNLSNFYQGFFKYISDIEYDEAEYNMIITDGTTYERLSVFALKNSDDLYICGLAIFLQVLYALFFIASVWVIVYFYRRHQKKPNSKNK